MRVGTGPGKAGKTWNFVLTFSGREFPVLVSLGNQLNSSNEVFRIYVKRNACRPYGEWILKSWE